MSITAHTTLAKLAGSLQAGAGAIESKLQRGRMQAPRRILMVVESSGGGTGRHVLDLSEGLIARGCEVHIIYSTGRADRMFLDRLASIPGLRHAEVPMGTPPRPGDVGVVLAVRRYIRWFGPFAVIHGHSSKGGAIARLAAPRSGARAFYTLHGLIMLDPGLPRWKWLLYLGIDRLLCLWTMRIIAVAPEEQRAAQRLGLGQGRVILIPNGVGDPLLTPRADARRRLGFDETAVVVGFVGRLVEQKAPEVLVRAFALACAAAPHARLAVIGDGPLRPAMHELARELGVAEKIIWLGECDARGLMAGFDVFAISSRKEGLPYVVLEAMAAGLPVIATSSAGVEILVESGFNGDVVPPGDAAAFARPLAQLVCDPERIVRYGRNALERAKRFTVDNMVGATYAAYAFEDQPR